MISESCDTLNESTVLKLLCAQNLYRSTFHQESEQIIVLFERIKSAQKLNTNRSLCSFILYVHVMENVFQHGDQTSGQPRNLIV